MSRTPQLAVAMCLVLANSLFGQQPEQPSSAPGSAVEAVVLTDARPIRLRLQAALNDVPFQAAIEDQARQAFEFLDRDGDQALSSAEAAPSSSLYGIQLHQPATESGVAQFLKLFVNVPEKPLPEQPAVAFQEFLKAWEANKPQFNISNTVSQRNADQDVWKLIDRDGNQQLSPVELAATHDVLRRWDLNDDDKIASQDLKQFVNPFYNNSMNRQESEESLTGVRLLRSSAEIAAAVETMFGLYADPASSTSVPLERWPELAESYRQYDLDQDQQLSAPELTQMLEASAADLMITLRFPELASQSEQAEISCECAAAAAEHVTVLSQSATSTTLQIGDVRLHLAARWNPIPDYNQYFTQQFQQFDTDQNKYLDETEWKNTYHEATVFDVADHNGDEKVFEDEWLRYENQTRGVTAIQLTVACSNAGRSLFATIDTNSDQFLSIREQRAAAELLEHWDKNGDGQLSLDELPISYHAAFQSGGAVISYYGQAPASQAASSASAAAGAPLWFERLDRNGDGDVSRAEFPGPLEFFQKLDGDGDSLLSIEEAQSAN